jgi:hypothetical protein
MTERQGQTEGQTEGQKGQKGQKGLKGKPELVPFEDLLSFDVRVEQVGPGEDGTIWVKLTDTRGSFEGVWFIALYTIALEVLQTALVAVAHRLAVGVLVTGTGDRSEIYRFQVLAA